MRKLAKDETLIDVVGGVRFKRWDLWTFGNDSACWGVVLGVGLPTCGYGYRLRIKWTKNPERDLKRWRKKAGN